MNPATPTSFFAIALIAAYFIHRRILGQVEADLKADPLNIKLKADLNNHSTASQILCTAAICTTLYALATLNPQLSHDLINPVQSVDGGAYKPVGR